MVCQKNPKRNISLVYTIIHAINLNNQSRRLITSSSSSHLAASAASSSSSTSSYTHKAQTFEETPQPFPNPKPETHLSSHWSFLRDSKSLVSCQGNRVSGWMEDPLVSSQRIRLRDGRLLAYREKGVQKDEAKYKIILVHGFGSSKEMNFNASQELIEELGIYFLLYDRAGYGESDPNPKRSLKSEVLDIEELADQLQIGSKFYLIGVSMGSYPTWGCLKHIPRRLAGVAFVAPVVNYRWPSLPNKVIKKDYRRGFIKWLFRISKYAPGLLHWWVIQKLFPSTSSVLESNPVYFNSNDIEVLKRTTGFPMLTKDKLRERNVFDTLRDDFLVGFGHWDFDPADLSISPESSVHIWHGNEDKVVPSQLQRCILNKQPWIKYHEIPEGGHLIVHYDGTCDAILRALLLGEEQKLYKLGMSVKADS